MSRLAWSDFLPERLTTKQPPPAVPDEEADSFVELLRNMNRYNEFTTT